MMAILDVIGIISVIILQNIVVVFTGATSLRVPNVTRWCFFTPLSSLLLATLLYQRQHILLLDSLAYELLLVVLFLTGGCIMPWNQMHSSSRSRSCIDCVIGVRMYLPIRICSHLILAVYVH